MVMETIETILTVNDSLEVFVTVTYKIYNDRISVSEEGRSVYDTGDSYSPELIDIEYDKDNLNEGEIKAIEDHISGMTEEEVNELINY